MSLESVSRIAELTGYAPRTIKGRLSKLTPIKEGRSHLYETKEALPAVYGAGDGAPRLDASQEKAMLDRERRKGLELANGKLEGSLLPADEVAEVWAHQVSIAKSHFLALPSRIAPRLLRCSTLRDAEAALRDEIHGILLELSSGGASD